jgi:hypothetical protein
MDLKKLVAVGVLVAGVYFALQFFKQTDTKAFHSMAKIRVETIFENLKGRPSDDPQKAIGFWRIGGNEPASDATLRSFERWLEEKNLRMKIGSYEYLSSRMVNEEDVVGRHAIVNFKVDGRTLSVAVRQGSPVEWAN